VTAAIWVAGGLLFRWSDERLEANAPPEAWPGVTVLIPAFNEAALIGTTVRATLAADYPHLEVLVLDDGSTDDTAVAASAGGAGDKRLEVIRDPVNRGKAARLNLGFERARHDLVLVSDADTHLHPAALKLLVMRLLRSDRAAAVAGAPHVTNRNRVLEALQVLEAASIIGLIRRTQALSGAVGTVAGVVGLFRRDAVIAAGGYDGRMATEDIDLSWRLLLDGWQTLYEPQAFVGMQVPSTLRALWAQRKRWARGQGEVMRRHFGSVLRWRNRRLWPLALESAASLLWVSALALSLLLTVFGLLADADVDPFGLGLAWGIAISVIATIQLAFALTIDLYNDRRAMLAFLLGPLYPIAFWMISAAAALRSQTVGLARGPADADVTWDVPREPLDDGEA